MGTKEDQSLKPFRQRVVPPYKSPRGNYRSSIFGYAQLVSLSAGNLVIHPFDPSADTPIAVLLWVQDYGIAVQAFSFYNDVRFVINAANFDLINQWPPYGELVNELGRADADGWPQLITPDVAAVDVGERITGETITNELTVDGYPHDIVLLDRSLINTSDTTALCLLKMWGWVASGVLDGYPMIYSGANTAPLGPGGGDFVTRDVVILREEDYTEQMQDDDNTFVGAAGVRSDIIGLWAATVQA